MAEGFGYTIDISGFGKALDDADKKLKHLEKTSANTAKTINDAFAKASEGGVQKMIESLSVIKKSLQEISSGANSKTISNIGKGANEVANDINSVASAVERVNENTKKKFSNNAIVQLNDEIDESKRKLSELISRLGEVNEKLQFYAKGEGQKAAGTFFDTTEYQEEAKQLMKTIEELSAAIDNMNKKKASLHASASRSYASGVEQDKIDNEWFAMEREKEREKREEMQETARIANETAKANIKAYDEAYIAYEALFDKAIALEDERTLKQNQSAKAFSEAWKESYESTQRFYENWINEVYAGEQADFQKQNADAKQKSLAAKNSYEEQLRAYEEMFDKIEKKEQASREAREREEKKINKEIFEDRLIQFREENRERQRLEGMIRDTERKNHEERQKEYQELFSGRSMSYQGAVVSSNLAKSMAEDKQAIKDLEAAREKLNRTDKDYEEQLEDINNRLKQHHKNIKDATKGSKELGESHSKLLDIGGQLARKLALVFSVSQITGYIRKLVEVRGEFELQQRALQAIVQNVDEANKLWEKTVALAVKSPFRVKELVTYTKQLAAYRVETDKLYDTTKMLADVSAGLGVDMQRLILAYGQVKAANYLRGTELRQFSEAGINILGELSKYFTELEGRAVSVGDVFERVSKRMVSFADVEKIFNRITSEGGVFYNMQEIQSETLKGQISNLRDSIDVMLNEIGTSKEGLLKGSIQVARELIENWKTISTTVIPVLGAFIMRWGLFKLSTIEAGESISNFANTFRKHFGVVITQLTRGAGAAKQFAKSTKVSIMGGWTTVILAVAAAITTLVKVMQNANRVKRELEKIDLGGSFDASHSVAEYKRLASVVSDTSKSYDEQQKALSTLKAKYADILPSHLLESKTIKALGGDYGEATRAIYDYIAAKTKEKQIEVIQSEFGADVNEQAQDLADDIKKALAKVAPNIKNSDVLPIVNRLQEMIKLGEVDIFNVDEAIKSLVRQFTGLEISSNAWRYTFSSANGEMVTLENNAESLVTAMRKMKNAMDEVTTSSLSWQDSFIYQDFNKVKDEYEEQSKAIGKYYDTIREYKRQSELESRGEGKVSDELKRDYDSAVSALNSIFVNAGKEAPKWNEIINEPFKLDKATIDANVLLWQGMIKEISSMPIIPSKEGARKNYVELLEGEQTALKGTEKQQEIKRVAQNLADTMKVSLKGLDELFLKSDESMSDYAKRVSETLKTYSTNILEFDKDVENGTNFATYTKEQVDLMRTQLPFLKEYLKLFKAYLPNKSTTTEDTFSPMLRTVKEIYEEYKKLKETFDDITAKEGAMAKFGDAFKEAFGKTPEDMGFDLFSEEGVKKAYDYLIKKAPDAKKKIQAELAKGEIVWDVKIQKKKDADKELADSIQKMFDRYDFTVEMKKLNIPLDLAEKIFNVKTIDLSSLRAEVQAELTKAIELKGQDDRVKQLQDFLKTIDNLEIKQQEEAAKRFVELLTKTLDETKVILERKGVDISLAKKYFDKGDIDATTFVEMVKNITEEANREIGKVNFQKFKESPEYIQAMGDMSIYTKKELEELRDKLQKVVRESKGVFSTEEVKDYQQALAKLNDAIDDLEKSPFRWESFAKVKDILEVEEDIQDQKEKKEKAEKDILDKQKKQVKIEEKLNSLQKEKLEILKNIKEVEANGGDTTSLMQSLARNESLISSNTQDFQNITNEIGSLRQTSSEASSQLDVLGGKLKSFTGGSGGGFASIIAIIDTIVHGVNDTIQGAKELVDEIGEVMETFGKETDLSTDFGKTQKFFDIFSKASQAATNAWDSFKNGDAIGTTVGIVKSITEWIKGINTWKDESKELGVQDHLEEVEKLEKEYEKLEWAISRALSIEKYGMVSKQAKNLGKQLGNTQKAIELENSKKKTDKKRIEELKASAEEAERQIQELYDGLREDIVGSYEDLSSTLADAMIDALRNGEDALKAWSKSVDEIIGDIVKKIAVQKYVEPEVSKALDQFYNKVMPKNAAAEQAFQKMQSYAKGSKAYNEAYQKYLKLNEQALKEIPTITEDSTSELKQDLENIGVGFEPIAEMIAGLYKGADMGGLTALEKGIGAASEESIQVLTAYWNSVRQYTANIDSKMDLVLANMNMTSEDNPMLAQLMITARQTTAINALLSSVTKGGHSEGGVGIKVFMN